MPKLIFDIETIGEDFEKIDGTTQEVLRQWLKKETENGENYKLTFSPLTGEIVVIGVLDYDKNQGAIYFQAPDKKIDDFEEDGIKYKRMTEKEMLEKFWELAKNYNEFISFNGRSFDAPFLMVRSAIHKIKPTKDLLLNRYINSQKLDAKHIDLFDQLSFYGALRKAGGLYLWARAFGIKTPKSDGITGDDIGKSFKEGKYEDIVRYNKGDLIATKELYTYWDKYLRF